MGTPWIEHWMYSLIACVNVEVHIDLKDTKKHFTYSQTGLYEEDYK